MNDVSGGAGFRGPESPIGSPRPPRGGPKGAQGISGAQFAGVGLQFALTIVVFAFAGIWLDKHLGTSPWLVILGVFLGAAAGFFSIYRQLMAAQRDAGRGTRGGGREAGGGGRDST